MTSTELTFTPWTVWEERPNITGTEHAGVYVLGRFRDGPPRRLDLLDDQVVYFGETVGQSLLKRWWQFNRSAFQEKPGHSGGWTYRETVAKTSRGLYVSALPVPTDELMPDHAAAYIRHVERKLIWEFVDKHKRMPICNSK